MNHFLLVIDVKGGILYLNHFSLELDVANSIFFRITYNIFIYFIIKDVERGVVMSLGDINDHRCDL